MLTQGRTEFPTLGFSGPPYDAVATRRPDEFGGWGRGKLVGLGQTIDSPWPWGNDFGTAKRFGDSFTMSGLGQSFFGDLSLQTLILLGIGGWVAYKMLFGTTARVRRRAVGEARREHRRALKDIRSKYPRFG